MTAAEKKLWKALRRNQLDGLHFRRQQIIDGFIVDFYCHAVGLVVEVDGPIHDKAEQVEYDAERERVLEVYGLHLLRVRNEEVMQDLGSVLERIRDACRAGEDLTPQPPSLPGKGEYSPPLAGEGPGEGSGKKPGEVMP
jgi:very-short-patch-repair endonuclease